jgi:hypothetical protein
MIRSVLTFALGAAIVGCALGCGDSSKSSPPKDDVPIIKGGPQPGTGGQPGKGGDKNVPPSGTAY